MLVDQSALSLENQAKYAKWLNLSTMVKTADFCPECGRPVTKSMDMWDQGLKIGHKNLQSKNLVLCAPGWLNVEECAALTLSSMLQKMG